jgi:hypothetical protein
MDSYFERLENEGSKSLVDARGRTKLHILPKLGTIAVAVERFLSDRASPGRPATSS